MNVNITFTDDSTDVLLVDVETVNIDKTGALYVNDENNTFRAVYAPGAWRACYYTDDEVA